MIEEDGRKERVRGEWGEEDRGEGGEKEGIGGGREASSASMLRLLSG